LRKAWDRLSARDNLYLAPAIGYAVAMLAYFVVTGRLLQFLPVLFFLAAIPVLAILGAWRGMARYWVPFISILLSYEALAGIVGSFAASKAIFSIYPIDRAIWGFNVTGWVQSTFYSTTMTEITSFFYTLHFPLVVITSGTLWYFRKALFGRYVVAMVITSYASLLTFILLPTAPPWYQGVATDLYQSTGSSVLPNALSSAISMIESDKFAAFPSLHTAYVVIFAYFMIRLDRRLALVAVPVVLGVLFSTLYLGQHYLIDLIAGFAYAIVPCLIAERFHIRVPGSDAGSARPAATSSPPQPEWAPNHEIVRARAFT
jgi:membrane-associated phospholipid phosphatase